MKEMLDPILRKDQLMKTMLDPSLRKELMLNLNKTLEAKSKRRQKKKL
jgi:hypothetical protein